MAHQLVCVVAVFVQAVAAQIPHVLLVYAWPDVVELPQHSMLGDVNHDLSIARHSTGTKDQDCACT